jgi:hypothetical protein
MLTVPSIRHIPLGAIRAQLQADGTVVVYMPGDTLPPDPPDPGPQPEPVPQSVTKRQLYRGLMQMGWLGTTMSQIDAAINAMIGAMPEPPREVARVEFFTSRDFLRNNPMLLSALMGPPLSKTAEQVDDFFRLCGSFAPEGEA